MKFFIFLPSMRLKIRIFLLSIALEYQLYIIIENENILFGLCSYVHYFHCSIERNLELVISL